MTPQIPPEKAGTLVVTREMRALPGHEPQLEETMQRVIDRAAQAQGHLGVTVIRPHKPGEAYRFLYRFDSIANLEAWHDSEDRRALMADVEPHLLDDSFKVHDGFAVWLDLPPGSKDPPKWKLVTVAWLSIYPIVVVATVILNWVGFTSSVPLRVLVLTGITVPAAAYIVTPAFSRWARPWLMSR